ncbi:MAG: PrsW family intramembrane metalloprotease [Prevotellaceae bacterium]|nr:PrsW family intramembrane metalloprotease [Candidatus Minthosoma caballi]
MIYLIATFIGILPALVLLIFIYKKDRLQHEPWGWILKAFGFGMLSCIPAVIIENILPEMGENNIFGSFYSAFFVASGTEEALKLFMLWLLLKNNPHFDEHMDGIVYAACVSLGFACLENVGYMFNSLEDLATVGLMRALISVPAHFFFAVFMGYYYSLAAFGPESTRKRNYVLAFLIPFLWHGAYDFALMSMQIDTLTTIISLIAIVVVCRLLWIYGKKKMNEMLEYDEKLGVGKQ